jgi:hypothetical protein
LVPHKFLYAPMFGLKFGSRLSAIESCTYLHPPNMDMNLFLDYCVEYYHTNMYNTCLCGHKS